MKWVAPRISLIGLIGRPGRGYSVSPPSHPRHTCQRYCRSFYCYIGYNVGVLHYCRNNSQLNFNLDWLWVVWCSVVSRCWQLVVVVLLLLLLLLQQRFVYNMYTTTITIIIATTRSCITSLSLFCCCNTLPVPGTYKIRINTWHGTTTLYTSSFGMIP